MSSSETESLLGKGDSPHPGSARKHVSHLVLLSFGFLAVFTAFGATQNLESSLIPGKLGYFSIAAIYAGFCFGALFLSAPVVQAINPKWAMVIASLTYASLMAANLKPTWGIIIPCATVLGLGASILWPGQGAYITAAATNYARAKNQETKAALGMFNGIFWMIFQLSQVIGNVTASLVLSHANGPHSSAVKILFYLFLGVALFGTVLLALLPKETNPQASTEKISIGKRIIAPFYLFKDIRMILLWPIFIYAGMESGFWAGDFTKTFITDTVGPFWIGYILATYGAIDAISSFVVGKIADVLGKKATIGIGFISHISFFIFCLIFLKIGPGFEYWKTKDHIWSLFVMAGVWGVGDAVWNTIGSVILGYYFGDQIEAAFSNSKLFQSIGYIIALVWAPYVPIYYKILGIAILLVVCMLCLFILDRISPLDKKSEKQVN